MLDTIEEIKPVTKDGVMLATGSWILSLFFLIGPLISLAVFFNSKEDKFVRLHALQAAVLEISITLVTIAITISLIVLLFLIPLVALSMPVLFILLPLIPLLIAVISLFILLCTVIFYLYCAHRAYKGQAFLLPLIGRLALKAI